MVPIEPSLPWLMALSIGEDLVAADLADDDPAGVHAQRPADEVGHGDRALALDVGFPRLQRDHVGVRRPGTRPGPARGSPRS